MAGALTRTGPWIATSFTFMPGWMTGAGQLSSACALMRCVRSPCLTVIASGARPLSRRGVIVVSTW